MNYEYKKSFERGVKKVPDSLKTGILEIIENIKIVNNVTEIIGVKKWLVIKTLTEFVQKILKIIELDFILMEKLLN